MISECQECKECSFRSECVKGKSGKRTITRTEADPIREAMRTKVQSDAGKAIYQLRKGIVEPSWGEIKECQGFRHLTCVVMTKLRANLLCFLLPIIYERSIQQSIPNQRLYINGRSLPKNKKISA